MTDASVNAQGAAVAPPPPSSTVSKHCLRMTPNQEAVPRVLNDTVATICHQAITARGVFAIALSGGSLAGFLSSIRESFLHADPRFDAWHVILADERCVPTTDADSNMGSLQEHFFSKTSIPADQIHGVDEKLLSGPTDAIAAAYEETVRNVLEKSGGALDLAVLGFGPDGHTCSLFPGHALLEETKRHVAAIDDSPKPPPKRITLTFPVLNALTRHVIFCGAGASKSPILQQAFSKVSKDDGDVCGDAESCPQFSVTLTRPAPFPCAMVDPRYPSQAPCTVTWVVDSDAMNGVTIS